MDLTRFGADDGDDLFLTQATYKVEQDLERYEDVMLSQVADYLEKDYSLEQTMQSYLPITGDFDLLDVNFDLGYLLSAEQLPPESERVDIKPDINPTEGRFPVVSDIEMQQLVHKKKKKKKKKTRTKIQNGRSDYSILGEQKEIRISQNC